MAPLPVRVVFGHARITGAAAFGLIAFALLPATISPLTRAIVAWDLGCTVFLLLVALAMSGERMDRMAADAEAQEEGEWTVFSLAMASSSACFAAIVGQYAQIKDLPPASRGLHVALVATTLLLSWLVTQALFALRYAHEYYSRSAGADGKVDGGLTFPGDKRPDYWDFVYFALVLGMTFQVSDVQITSRKLRRLATAHGFISFLYNTIILALSVNIAASLL
jgi:uncharacterized membrane protein